MAAPELDVARIRQFCKQRVPEHALHQVRVEATVRGNSVTIVERRAPWREDFGPEWSTFPIAQLRWSPQWQTWQLYCRDRNLKWHEYDRCKPTPRLDMLLNEVDADPTCIFWG